MARLTAVCALGLFTPIHAAVSLPAIFSDGMVLQSHANYGQRPLIFGKSDPGEYVYINLTVGKGSASTSSAVADATGSWTSMLPANDAATNVTLAVWGSSDPATVLTINDAVYGDVFLCGGQSNMVMSVIATFDGAELSNISWPNIRLFNVIEAGATAPQADLPPAANYSNGACIWYDNPPDSNPNRQKCQTWQVAEPGVTEYMSAICFYTAMYLQTTGFIAPGRIVGLVHSALPGTAMELWAQQPVIDACTQYLEPEQAREHFSAPTISADVLAAAPHLAAIPPGNSTLFNAMINPIAGFAIRAALWDQGESNAGQPYLYFSCLFQGLIESWRRLWRIGDFAWTYVGLGPQEYNSNMWPSYSATPRDAQMSALPGHGTTDTSGIVVAYDLGDRSSPYQPAHVHTRNKTEIGRRMALLLQHVQWGQQWPAGGWPLPNGTAPLDWSGPWPVALSSNADGSFSLTFSSLTGQGIYMAPTADCWECCEAKDTFQFLTTNSKGEVEWVNATAALVPGSPAVAVTLTPVTPGTYSTIRYAPSLWPQCAVFSASNQIPANTFSSFNITTSGATTADLHFGYGAASSQGAAEAPAVGHLRATVAQVVQKIMHEQSNTGRVQLVPSLSGSSDAGTVAGNESDGARSTWKGQVIRRPSTAGLVAATPPLGWNSWNAYHCNIDDNLIRHVADVLVSSGLAAAGYSYVNIDDCWQVDRMANGTIIPDPVRFPYGMRAVADYVHSKGLNFGVYTAQGSRTCQGRPGAYLHEQLDAATYCSWGLDYLKIDLCGGTMRPVLNTSWSLFHQGFQDCVAQGGRPIVESIEYCQDPSPTGCGPWIGQIANVWRTTADIQATFSSVLSNLDNNNIMAQWTKPGNWADPDMLQIGNPGLSLEESKTHFTAWCIVAAPLLIGADLVSGIDQAYMEILMAPEVLAVNQDVLGVQGIRVSPANASGTECWAKPLSDGSVAAMLINRGTVNATAACTWAELGLKDPGGTADVRDLWARADLGQFAGGYSATLPMHAAAMIKVKQ